MKSLILFIFLALSLNGIQNTEATLIPLLLNTLLTQNQPFLHPLRPVLHPISPLQHPIAPLLRPDSPLSQQVQYQQLLQQVRSRPLLQQVQSRPLLQQVQSRPLLQQVQSRPLLQQGQALLHPVQSSSQYCQMDQTVQFRDALYEFSLNFYNALSDKVNDHFVTSPFSIWMSLAALAEGAAPEVQERLFKVLGLPDQFCLRQKFYIIALGLESPGTDVSLIRHRGIILDKRLEVNKKWSNFVKTSNLLVYATAPLQTKPKLTEQMLQKAIASQMQMPLQGNSVLIDSLTYRGLWTNAFDTTQISMEPFYDDSGLQTGTVEMMRIKLRTRIADLPLFKAKVVELPVGDDGRYTMLIGLGMEKSGAIRKLVNVQHGRVIYEIMSLLKLTPGPIEIAIPKIALNTDFDAKYVLEEIGITDIWTDPAATEYVSNPAALPGGLIQHVKMAFSPEGITPPPSNNGVALGGGLLGDIVNAVGDYNFIANRPFMFVLIESANLNVLFAGCYSDPNKN